MAHIQHLQGSCGHEIEERLHTTAKIHLTPCLSHRLVIRETIKVIKRADPRIHGIGRQNVNRNRRVVSLWRNISGMQRRTATRQEQS